MDFSEKLLTLRKANDLTQEQLAEKLEVSTDYLLKSSEIDDLSVKTEILEKQQQMMLGREQKQRQIFSCIMCSVAAYLVFFAVCFIEHYLFFELDFFGDKEVIIAEFLITTAIVIFTCVKKLSKEQK